MQDTGCLGWCTGMTQRDGTGREVGVGFRMGNTCTPMVDSCWCMTKLDSVLKSRDITNKGLYSQSYGFSSSHVWMWELDHKEGWVPKNWCFQTVVLEKTLESPLDSKIKPVNPKGNQSWILIERIDVETETPILWPPDAKSWLTGKDPGAGEDWRQEEKAIEDEMLGWRHQLNGHEFEPALGGSEGQGSLRAAVHRVAKSLTLLSNWTICDLKGHMMHCFPLYSMPCT